MTDAGRTNDFSGGASSGGSGTGATGGAGGAGTGAKCGAGGTGGSVWRARTAGLLAVAAVTVTLAACADGDEGHDAQPPAPTVTTDSTVTETETADPGDGNDDGFTGPDNGTRPDRDGADPVPDGQLPGDDIVTFFAEAGRTVDVVGVKTGDVLFVRALPDATSEEVGRLAPTGDAVLAGRERAVGPGTWAEVELSDGVGWVNSSYLAYIPDEGQDITSEAAGIAADSDAADAEDLAREIGEARAARSGGGAGPRATLVETPAHDVLVYRVDVLGLPDDSVRGERVEIFLEETADGYEVTEATSYPICGRGTGDGLCV